MKNLQIERIENTSNLKGLNVTKLITASKNVKAKSKSSFEYTFEFARLVTQSANYFKTKECKDNLEIIGITWKIEDFFNNLGEGFGKAWCYRLIKAVKFEYKTILVDNVETKLSNLQAYLDNSTSFSIAEFIKFAQGVPTEKEKVENKLTLTFGKNTLSINNKDELSTKMTNEQIKAVIILLTRKLSAIS